VWLEIISSLFGGGLTGLIGSVISNIFNYKTKKLDAEMQVQKYAQEIALKKADAEIMAQEWAARTKMAETEAKGREAEADAKAFEASFGQEPSRYSEDVKPTSAQGWLLILMDMFRAVVRPGLTVYLCVLTTMLYLDAHKLLKQTDFPQQDATALVTRIIGMILYLTTTCVLWWFGTRQKADAPK